MGKNTKRLLLSRETVRTINEDRLARVAGGSLRDTYDCGNEEYLVNPQTNGCSGLIASIFVASRGNSL